MHHSHSSILITPIFFCLLHSAVSQQQQLKVQIPKNSQGRIFSLSDKAPITTVLGKHSSYVNSTVLLTQHFQYIENYVRSARFLNQNRERAHAEAQVLSPRSLQICNTPDTFWANAVRVVSLTNGWPAEMSRCTSGIYGIPQPLLLPSSSSSSSSSTKRLIRQTNASSNNSTNSTNNTNIINSNTSGNDNELSLSPTPPTYHASQLRDALVERVTNISAASSQIKKSVLSNWTYLEFRGNDSTVRQSIQCSLHFSVGVKIEQHWHIAVSFTNHPQAHWVEDGTRFVVTEYMRLDPKTNNSLIATNLTLPLNPTTGTVHQIVNNATTRLVIRSGSSSTSGFHRQITDEAEAVIDALELAQNTVHHADDALVWSNLAILSLPLILNIMPISLITKITSFRMMMYVIVSDLIGGLPMLIKGIEVTVIGGQDFTSLFTRMGDPSASVVTAEVWTAQCKARDNIERSGIILVGIAVASSLAGIFIEVFIHYLGKSRYNNFLLTKPVSPQLGDEHYRSSLMDDIDLEY